MNRKGEVRESLDPLIEDYLEYLMEVGRKRHDTVKDVRCSLKRIRTAMAVLAPKKPIWKAPLVDLLRWMEHEREQGTSLASHLKYVSHLRGFLEYAWRSGHSDRNALDGFHTLDRSDRTEPKSLSEAEAKQLIEACPRSTAAERRDRAIVLILYGCGLRNKELRELRVQDVDVKKKELFIRHGKGDRERMVPIPDAVHTELLAYLLERGGKRGPLFRTDVKRRAVQSRDVSEIVQAAARRAQLAGRVTPKVLRHSYATHLMDHGVDVAVISRLMGHRSPRETGVYLHVLEGRKEEAVERLDRRSGGKP
jgi:integrase/recombinase XerD